ncbi:MAG TPA: succinate dehydrogenase/fumarate reductase flavoprotein subunit, partial [Thermomicrobiales bacterium]|nr:succinate dehydrogenase/fumarate reductase flavoprotein subunit [Thermomicrobiales bacterium]
ESACVSVHGANRLGTNSLVDLVVFGRRAGRHMLEYLRTADWPTLAADPELATKSEVSTILSRPKGESIVEIRTRMQEVMMAEVSVVRNAEGLTDAKKVLGELRDAYNHASIDDKGAIFNTDLMEAMELGYMLDCADTIVAGALARQESRGAHYRTDFEARDDKEWLAHTMLRKTSGGVTLSKKPIVITKFQPKERKY